jgi:hypothetical protein
MRTANARLKGHSRRLARLTAFEDHCWTFAFCFYLDEGKSDLAADRLAWRDMCLEFPRLLRYDGCLP